MSYVAVEGGMLYPNFSLLPSANTNVLLDATGEKLAVLFIAPKAGDLKAVVFRTGTVTTGDTLKVSFQNMDATTGNPDESVDQYRTIVIDGADDNVWKTTGIVSSDGTDGGAKRTVALGERVWIVFEFDSYVAGNLNLVSASLAASSVNSAYISHKTGGSWAKDDDVGCCYVTYSDDSTEVAQGLVPGVASSATHGTGSTPDEVGNMISVPFGCKVSGAYILCDVDNACDIILYDSDGSTALATVSMDPDERQGTAVGNISAVFSSAVTLAANTDYRLVVKPTTASTVGVRYSVVPTLDPIVGGGDVVYTSRTDAGSWSQTTTQILRAHLVISEVETGGGGGGGGPLVGGRLVR